MYLVFDMLAFIPKQALLRQKLVTDAVSCHGSVLQWAMSFHASFHLTCPSAVT